MILIDDTTLVKKGRKAPTARKAKAKGNTGNTTRGRRQPSPIDVESDVGDEAMPSNRTPDPAASANPSPRLPSRLITSMFDNVPSIGKDDSATIEALKVRLYFGTLHFAYLT